MTQHLCDANIWLALTIPTHSHHAPAQRWLDALGTGDGLLFCRATQQSFLRLMTTRAVVSPYGFSPLTNTDAWATFDLILADDRIALDPGEPAGIATFWRQFASRTSPSPKLWMDAYLAAFARSGGYRLVTIDRAFRQFRSLDLELLDTSR